MTVLLAPNDRLEFFSNQMMIRHEHAMRCDETLHTRSIPIVDMIMMMLIVLCTGVSKRLESWRDCTAKWYIMSASSFRVESTATVTCMHSFSASLYDVCREMRRAVQWGSATGQLGVSERLNTLWDGANYDSVTRMALISWCLCLETQVVLSVHHEACIAQAYFYATFFRDHSQPSHKSLWREPHVSVSKQSMWT